MNSRFQDAGSVWYIHKNNLFTKVIWLHVLYVPMNVCSICIILWKRKSYICVLYIAVLIFHFLLPLFMLCQFGILTKAIFDSFTFLQYTYSCISFVYCQLYTAVFPLLNNIMLHDVSLKRKLFFSANASKRIAPFRVQSIFHFILTGLWFHLLWNNR